jgi:hypothetical protein
VEHYNQPQWLTEFLCKYKYQITFKNFSLTSASNGSLIEWKIALFVPNFKIQKMSLKKITKKGDNFHFEMKKKIWHRKLISKARFWHFLMNNTSLNDLKMKFLWVCWFLTKSLAF